MLVTTTVSPFWCEFLGAVNQAGQVSVRVAFTGRTYGDRGPHWGAFEVDEQLCRMFSGGMLDRWLAKEFSLFEPHIVIVGGVRIEAEATARGLARNAGLLFGYFAEQPNRRGIIQDWLNRVLYRIRFSQRQPDFLLAVGDRAVDVYRGLLPSKCPVISFPYYQDLRIKANNAVANSKEVTQFLFSGRLLARNSIKETVAAFEQLAHAYPHQFKWCISAYGPEEHWIRAAMARSEVLAASVYFDREFETWEDRLRPFRESDVLVVAGRHSGWGLVVPEALAAGIPVITTRGVEAGRYYIQDMVNGLIVRPRERDIYDALAFVLECPESLAAMKARTKSSAMKGDIRTGVDHLNTVVGALMCRSGMSCIEKRARKKSSSETV